MTWSWKDLPGLEVSRKDECGNGYFVTDGIMSVGQQHVEGVLKGIRLGLSMVHWLCSPATYGDAFRAAEIKAMGAIPCARCDGTGNELMRMFRQCSACGGSGISAPGAQGAA